jgi:hypothetical protein
MKVKTLISEVLFLISFLYHFQRTYFLRFIKTLFCITFQDTEYQIQNIIYHILGS